VCSQQSVCAQLLWLLEKAEWFCAKYQVIYNWDGGPHGYGPPPQSMEQLLEGTFKPLADTQVGALFFSTGGHVADYPSEVLPLTREKSGRDAYESVGSMIGGANQGC
jgi:hypothetical protein